MLSIELRRQGADSLLICQGDVLGGKESDYLFQLMTREDKGDVILDLEGVRTIDEEGISVIFLGYELLTNLKRRLFLKNPSTDVLHALQQHQMNPILDSEKRLQPHFCGKETTRSRQPQAFKAITEKVM